MSVRPDTTCGARLMQDETCHKKAARGATLLNCGTAHTRIDAGSCDAAKDVTQRSACLKLTVRRPIETPANAPNKFISSPYVLKGCSMSSADGLCATQRKGGKLKRFATSKTILACKPETNTDKAGAGSTSGYDRFMWRARDKLRITG
mmetsp:Transcript_9393/g.16656  ORF Transcript_9393/g.16656 Transcript_9393/m.16656 type:complete len:148 (+) Transcript_9393:473-916(+)